MISEGDRWGTGEFPEPELSPGFARRVLRLAEIERKRRVRRHFLVMVGLCGIVSFVATILVRELGAHNEKVSGGNSAVSVARAGRIVTREESSRAKTEIGIAIGTVDEASQRGAIDYLFPDAQWTGDFALAYGNRTKPSAGAADSAAFSPLIERRCRQCSANRVKRKQQIAETDSADSPSLQRHPVPSALPLAPGDSRRQSETP